MNPIDRLMQMKDATREASTEKARAEGEVNVLRGELSKFGCKTIKEAKAKIEKLEDSAAKKERELAKDLHKLEEDYEW